MKSRVFQGRHSSHPMVVAGQILVLHTSPPTDEGTLLWELYAGFFPSSSLLWGLPQKSQSIPEGCLQKIKYYLNQTWLNMKNPPPLKLSPSKRWKVTMNMLLFRSQSCNAQGINKAPSQKTVFIFDYSLGGREGRRTTLGPCCYDKKQALPYISQNINTEDQIPME